MNQGKWYPNGAYPRNSKPHRKKSNTTPVGVDIFSLLLFRFAWKTPHRILCLVQITREEKEKGVEKRWDVDGGFSIDLNEQAIKFKQVNNVIL